MTDINLIIILITLNILIFIMFIYLLFYNRFLPKSNELKNKIDDIHRYLLVIGNDIEDLKKTPLGKRYFMRIPIDSSCDIGQEKPQ